MSKDIHLTKFPRIPLLDFARGIALIAMAIFHFAFDLEMFGVVRRGFINQPEWVYFARGIAGSFLFMVGFSLFLANVHGTNWKLWGVRFAKIAGAAALITIATWFATPDTFIFFGILHSITFASVAGLLFVRFPWWLNIIIALGIYAMRFLARTPMLDDPLWWWTGLSAFTPNSSDYVPVFPWFAIVLLGIAAAQLATSKGAIEQLAKPKLDGTTSGILRFLGCNSLIFYLLHQPIIIGLLYSALWLFGRI